MGQPYIGTRTEHELNYADLHCINLKETPHIVPQRGYPPWRLVLQPEPSEAAHCRLSPPSENVLSKNVTKIMWGTSEVYGDITGLVWARRAICNPAAGVSLALPLGPNALGIHAL